MWTKPENMPLKQFTHGDDGNDDNHYYYYLCYCCYYLRLLLSLSSTQKYYVYITIINVNKNIMKLAIQGCGWYYIYIMIMINYYSHIYLNSWAMFGWFPLLTMIPLREDSEVVIIYPYIFLQLSRVSRVAHFWPLLALAPKSVAPRKMGPELSIPSGCYYVFLSVSTSYQLTVTGWWF